MNKKATYIASVALIVVLTLVAVLAVVNMKNKYNSTRDVNDVKAEAELLYAQGKIDEAILSLETYCQYSITDIEAQATLGDWHMEQKEYNKAYSCYRKAATNKKADDEIISPLTIKNTSEVILKPAAAYALEITPDVRITKGMTLTITGQNLLPENINYGKIDGKNLELSDEDRYLTTDWFDVNPEGGYLTLSGGYNCAVWQFADKNGDVIAYAESGNSYRRTDTSNVNIYQMARAFIPENSAKCRITYYNNLLNEVTASPDETVTLVYGRLPGESRPPKKVTYKIPDLKEGEKITYKNGIWTMVSENGEEVLSDWELPSLDLGSHISIDGEVIGRVSLNRSTFLSYEKDKIYTIRFNLSNPSNMGERMDDARNMAFNGAVGNSFLSNGNNTFDDAYPWNEIRLCAIKDGTIIYKGEEGFSDSGQAGDVFVEIPKFYSKRVVDSEYDTISISGYPHEGFSVDEAFLTENGEAEAIYIGAYTCSMDNEGNLHSISDSAPVVYLSPKEMTQKVESRGDGYKVMDYAALSAIQKLFLVETGVRNSQCLYMGISGLTMATSPEKESGYSLALKSNNKTNCIDISGEYEYNTGDSVVIYSVSDYERSYAAATENPRTITNIIENADSTVSVFFNGEPMSVVQNDTAMAHIAKRNGATDSIGYHTGAAATTRGIHSFKYRHMENIWGNVHTYVDNLRVKGGKVIVTDRYGNLRTLSYSLPTTDYKKAEEVMIKKVGYDPYFSGIMLPTVIGEGATSSTYYGDAYLHTIDDMEEYTIHYGGGWNSAESAGLFSYAVLATENEGSMNASCRMMYLK